MTNVTNSVEAMLAQKIAEQVLTPDLIAKAVKEIGPKIERALTTTMLDRIMDQLDGSYELEEMISEMVYETLQDPATKKALKATLAAALGKKTK